jgi:hemoglobin-like flavoprotein
MTAALSQRTIDIVKSTVPALEVHGVAITRNMYERLFRDDDIKALFNQAHQDETASHPKALAGLLDGSVHAMADQRLQTLTVSKRKVCRTLGQRRLTQRRVPWGLPDEARLTYAITALP